MSIHQPIPMGSEFHENPHSLWEVMVDVDYDPTLSAEVIDRRKMAIWNRLIAALEKVVENLDANIEVTEIDGRGEQTPLFPLVVGRARYTATQDIIETVERVCKVHTELGAGVAHDPLGHAYELDIKIAYRRCPSLDGCARAPMPDPERTAELHNRRLGRSRGQQSN
jgi:hypothetical protein